MEYLNYETALKEIVCRDERFVVMTAENRAAIRSLPAALGARFIDTGISEQTLAAAAAGLALRGRIPVVHALAPFLTMRAFEFIRTDIGYANLPVKLVGFAPGFLSEANGPTHQALEDVALMRGIPGMTLFCPADEDELTTGLETVLLSPAPCYIRLNLRSPRFKHRTDFAMGKAEVLSKGKDITLLVYGALFSEALEAMEVLADQGYATGLINLGALKPIDEAAILDAAQNSALLVTIEDHFVPGGLYSIAAELFLKNQIVKPVLPLGLENRWFKPALLPDVLEYEGFTGSKIAERIIERKKNAEYGKI